MAQEEDPKLLIDACVARALVQHLAHHRGVDTIRSDDRLPQDAPDDEVLALAKAEGRVILTINAEDFRELAKATPGHPGLIIFPSVGKAKQIELGELIVERLWEDRKAGRAIEGHVYTVDSDGNIKRHKLP